MASPPEDHVDLYKFTGTGAKLAIDVDDHSGRIGENFVIGLYTSIPDSTGVSSLTLVAYDGLDAPATPKPPSEANDNAPYLEYTAFKGTVYYLLVGTAPVSNLEQKIGTSATGQVPFFNRAVPAAYTLIIQANPGASDPGSTIGDAVPFGPFGGRTTFGNLETGTDVDMYEIFVASRESVSFELKTPTRARAVLRLFDPSGHQLFANATGRGPDNRKGVGASGYFEYNFPASGGPFFVGVSTVANAGYDPKTESGRKLGIPTTYALRITDLDAIHNPMSTIKDPDLPTAARAAEKNGYFGALDRSTDVDMFRIQAQKGNRVGFTINAGLVAPPSDEFSVLTLVRVFDAKGHELARSRQVEPNQIQDKSYLAYTFPSSGTFYFGVSWFTNVAYNPITGTGRRGFPWKVVGKKLVPYDPTMFAGSYHLKIDRLR